MFEQAKIDILHKSKVEKLEKSETETPIKEKVSKIFEDSKKILSKIKDEKVFKKAEVEYQHLVEKFDTDVESEKKITQTELSELMLEAGDIKNVYVSWKWFYESLTLEEKKLLEDTDNWRKVDFRELQGNPELALKLLKYLNINYSKLKEWTGIISLDWLTIKTWIRAHAVQEKLIEIIMWWKKDFGNNYIQWFDISDRKWWHFIMTVEECSQYIKSTPISNINSKLLKNYFLYLKETHSKEDLKAQLKQNFGENTLKELIAIWDDPSYKWTVKNWLLWTWIEDIIREVKIENFDRLKAFSELGRSLIQEKELADWSSLKNYPINELKNYLYYTSSVKNWIIIINEINQRNASGFAIDIDFWKLNTKLKHNDEIVSRLVSLNAFTEESILLLDYNIIKNNSALYLAFISRFWDNKKQINLFFTLLKWVCSGKEEFKSLIYTAKTKGFENIENNFDTKLKETLWAKIDKQTISEQEFIEALRNILSKKKASFFSQKDIDLVDVIQDFKSLEWDGLPSLPFSIEKISNTEEQTKDMLNFNLINNYIEINGINWIVPIIELLVEKWYLKYLPAIWAHLNIQTSLKAVKASTDNIRYIPSHIKNRRDFIESFFQIKWSVDYIAHFPIENRSTLCIVYRGLAKNLASENDILTNDFFLWKLKNVLQTSERENGWWLSKIDQETLSYIESKYYNISLSFEKFQEWISNFQQLRVETLEHNIKLITGTSLTAQNVLQLTSTKLEETLDWEIWKVFIWAKAQEWAQIKQSILKTISLGWLKTELSSILWEWNDAIIQEFLNWIQENPANYLKGIDSMFGGVQLLKRKLTPEKLELIIGAIKKYSESLKPLEVYWTDWEKIASSEDIVSRVKQYTPIWESQKWTEPIIVNWDIRKIESAIDQIDREEAKKIISQDPKWSNLSREQQLLIENSIIEEIRRKRTIWMLDRDSKQVPELFEAIKTWKIDEYRSLYYKEYFEERGIKVNIIAEPKIQAFNESNIPQWIQEVWWNLIIKAPFWEVPVDKSDLPMLGTTEAQKSYADAYKLIAIDLRLEKIWNLKWKIWDAIQTWPWQGKYTGFNTNPNNFWNEKEINVFLISILKSIPKWAVKNMPNRERLKVLEKQGNFYETKKIFQLLDNQDATMDENKKFNWMGKIEDTFLQTYFPIWSTTFNHTKLRNTLSN